MFAFAQLHFLALASVVLSAATIRPAPEATSKKLDVSGTFTKSNDIAKAITKLSQKGAKVLDDPPVEPDVPAGYDFVFGPTSGSNNSPGYMGFVFLDTYDVQACADLCNVRGADANGGACQYFNIWQAVVSGVPTTVTCSLYYVPSDESTATGTGQGNLVVDQSRGYARQNLVIDGGFESYTCDEGPEISNCIVTSDDNWVGTTAVGGIQSASIWFDYDLQHSGFTVGQLGELDESTSFPGTLTPALPLTTVIGEDYVIAFFHYSQANDQFKEAGTTVSVVWNNVVVATITPGYSPWTYYTFPVTAAGDDVLAFTGGSGGGAWSFIDDVTVFLA